MALVACKECGVGVSKSAKNCPQCGAKLKMGFIAKALLVICGLWVFVVVVGITVGSSAKPNDTKTSNEPKQKTLEENLKLVDFNWKSAGFGNVFMLETIIIDNQNEYLVKDIFIRCDIYAKSGTKIDTVDAIIYRNFKAKSKTTFKNIDLNFGFIRQQAQSANCRILSAEKV